MKAKELQKELQDDCKDLLECAEREFAKLKSARSSGKLGEKSTDYVADKVLDMFVEGIKNRNKYLEKELKEFVSAAEAYEKKVPVSTSGKPPSEPVDNAAEKKKLEKAGKDLEEELTDYEGWIRSELVDPDVGEFARDAAVCLASMRKLEGALDKFLSEQLKRAAKITKPAEVIPSKFCPDYMKICSKYDLKVDTGVRDKLKRIDTNHEFEKVTSICKTGMHEVEVLIKLNRLNKPFVKDLQDLIKDIEKYDDHMFLLSRMK